MKLDVDKFNQWTIDFSQAKIALRNLDILIHNLTESQIAVAARLTALFSSYLKVLDQDEAQVAGDAKRIASLKEQVSLFTEIERKLHTQVARFVGKSNAQLDNARTQVKMMSAHLTKLRSLKGDAYHIAGEQLQQQIPEFLIVFDSFLARFTLELRWEQASYHKQLGEAFTHVGQAEPIKVITDQWWTEFEHTMHAVEALKCVHALPNLGATKIDEFTGESTPTPQARMAMEKTDSVLLQPFSWISSKVCREVKDFKFSDPRRGFFNKSTVPPQLEAETVQAVFNFEGETESDLAFKKGDLITVVDKGTDDDPNWWCGEIDGRRGLFPKNYVQNVHADEYIPKTDGQATEVKESEEFGDFKDAPTVSEHPPALPEHPPQEPEHPPTLPSNEKHDRALEHFQEGSHEPPKLPSRDKHSFAEIHEPENVKSEIKGSEKNDVRAALDNIHITDDVKDDLPCEHALKSDVKGAEVDLENVGDAIKADLPNEHTFKSGAKGAEVDLENVGDAIKDDILSERTPTPKAKGITFDLDDGDSVKHDVPGIHSAKVDNAVSEDLPAEHFFESNAKGAGVDLTNVGTAMKDDLNKAGSGLNDSFNNIKDELL